MSTPKPRNLGLRLDEATTADLDAFEAATGVEATTLARNALRACLDYWKAHGKISFPLRLVEAGPAVVTTKPFQVTQIIGPDPIQPTPAEKSAAVLNEDTPAIPATPVTDRLRARFGAKKADGSITS